MTAIGDLERQLNALYADGHVTGFGAGTTTHEPDCAGCAEARDLADQWDARWSDFDRERTPVTVDGVVVAMTRRVSA